MNNVIDIAVALEGKFHVKLIDASSGQVKQHTTFSNLITNAGLNAIGNDLYQAGGLESVGLYALSVGTGSTTPTVGDTTLAGHLAQTTSNGGISTEFGSSASPEYSFMKVTKVFTTGQANGQLTELGFFSPAGTLFNRSLFKDSLGNPTVIQKTSQDILQVIYELRLSGQVSDVTGTFDYSPIGSSTYVLRAQGINSSNQWNNAISRMGVWTPGSNDRIFRATNNTFFNIRTGLNNPATDAASSTAPSTIILGGYTPNTFYRDVTYKWTSLVGNLTSGLSVCVFSPWELSSASSLNRYLYQMQFTSALPKDTTRRLQLSIRFSWNQV